MPVARMEAADANGARRRADARIVRCNGVCRLSCLLSATIPRRSCAVSGTKLTRTYGGVTTRPSRPCPAPATEHRREPLESTRKFPASIRFRPGELVFVSKKQSGLGAILKAVAQGPERSSLFYWFCDNHDPFAGASAGQRIIWEPLLQHFNELELQDGAGKPPTAETARKTWLKARKDVAKRRALHAASTTTAVLPRLKRAPADWQPSGSTHPHAPSPTGGEHQRSQAAALAAALGQQQPGSSPSAGTHQDSDQPAPGSIEAARQKANLRSSLRANGDPLHKR